MIEAVLDASAVLADILDEPGAETVRALAPGAVLSAVNLAEVITKLIDHGLPAEAARTLVETMDYDVSPADQDAAVRAGQLHERTRRTGVSLGDRFCLALAQAADAPAITADRRWASLGLDLEIRLIR